MQQPKQQGLTLLEILLTIGLAGLILSALALFIVLITNARIKQETVLGVEEEGIRVISIITHALRNAQSINSPSPATDDNFISLATSNPSTNPTTFSLSGGKLYITEGNDAPIALTSSRYTVNDLLFANKTPENSYGSVRIQFSLQRTNPSNKTSLQYQKTFYGTGTIKQ